MRVMRDLPRPGRGAMMVAGAALGGREGWVISMALFEATTSAADGRVVVSLAGECDLTTREELTTVLLAAVDIAPVIVVDLTGLRFIDSSGVHGLITGHHAARRQGHRLHVVNAGGAVAGVLELTGVGELLAPPPADGTGKPTP
jgi:anti-sigma B factor antagonist